MGKTNAKGRSSESRHVRLYRYMWPALLERLDGNSFKALFYMLTFEEGSNNGQIYMGARSLGKGIGVDKKTALRCLQHLDRQGFIRPEELGYFTQKGGPATRWRFTFLPANGMAPTNEWRKPPAEEKSWGEIFPKAGGNSPPVPSVHRITGGKNGTAQPEMVRTLGGEKGTQTIASGKREALQVDEPGLDPQILDGSDCDGAAAVQAVRGHVAAYWLNLRTAARRRTWAASQGITPELLREYVIGNPVVLPFSKQAALASAIRAEKRANCESRAAVKGRAA